MKHLPVILAFALVAWSQTPRPGVIVGGGGGGGTGAANATATSAPAVTSLAVNVTALNLTSVDQAIVQCWSGTAAPYSPVTITSLNPTSLTSITANFVSTANVTCRVNATGTGPAGAAGATGATGAAGTNGAISQLQDEGSNLTVRPSLNFIGAGVSCVDNAGNTRTDCTISGGGGSSITYTITRTSGTVLTLPATSANQYAYCGASTTPGATITLTSGTGNAYVGLMPDCTIRVTTNLVAACSAGCTTEAGSAYNIQAQPLGIWAATAGAWDGSAAATLPQIGGALPIAAGANVSLTTSGGVTTIASTASGGSGATSVSALPATCTANAEYILTTTGGRFVCAANNNYRPLAIGGGAGGCIGNFGLFSSTGTWTPPGCASMQIVSGGTGVESRTSPSSTWPFGALALTTGTVATNFFGYFQSSPLFATGFFTNAGYIGEYRFALSSATQINALVGLGNQDGYLVYNQFIGLRYEATGSAGVFRFACQSTSLAYGSTQASTITADTNQHTLRLYIDVGGVVRASVDNEAPVTMTCAGGIAADVRPYIAVQTADTVAKVIRADTLAWAVIR